MCFWRIGVGFLNVIAINHLLVDVQAAVIWSAERVDEQRRGIKLSNSINFAIHKISGAVLGGSVLPDRTNSRIHLESGDSISFNLSQSGILKYIHHGNDLEIFLTDGRMIILEGFYSAHAELYISSGGEMLHVNLVDGSQAVVWADYSHVEVFEKWVPGTQSNFHGDDSFSPSVSGYDRSTAGHVASYGNTEIFGLAGLGLGLLGLGLAASSGGHSHSKDTSTWVGVDGLASAGVDGLASAGLILNYNKYSKNGVVIGGTGEPGSTIVVEVAGETLNHVQNQTCIVDGSGKWSVAFPTTELPRGEYDADVKITATDAAGNQSTTNVDLKVDTESRVSFQAVSGQAIVDHVISGAERTQTGGVVFAGAADPGATVIVGLGIASHKVTADAYGNWSTSFTSAEIPAGTYSTTATATATDGAGNVATTTYNLLVDTQVTDFSHSTPTADSIIPDGVVNAAEGARGVIVNGTVEMGSTVSVQLASGTMIKASVAADGTWTATIPASELPSVETNTVRLTVIATDQYGNHSTQMSAVDFDPLVQHFSTDGIVASNNVVNAQEAADGFTIRGTVEPNSDIVVTLENGASKIVHAGADGIWQASFDTSDFTSNSGKMYYTVTATDHAGNIGSLGDSHTLSFLYDLAPPTSPSIIDVIGNSDGTRSIYTGQSESDHYMISAIGSNGIVHTIMNSTPLHVSNDYLYDFGALNRVPNSEYLVLTDHDAAGNSTSTLMVVNMNSNITLDLSRGGLNQFDFSSIDLSHAQTSLTITANQIKALTGPDKELLISGDTDDHVTALGAVKTGHETIDGHGFSIYSLGIDGAHLIIDDHINLNNTI